MTEQAPPLYRVDALLDYAEALLQKAGLAASMAGAVARTAALVCALPSSR